MKKPVKFWVVVACLILVVCLVSTLFLPIFEINLSPVGNKGEFVGVTGLDIINAVFNNGVTYSSHTTGTQTLLDFLGNGVAQLDQYINPVFVNIMVYAYILSLAISCCMLIFTFFNFAGIRLSVFNVFSGLLTFLCGIILMLGVVLQNQEFVVNIVVSYTLRVGVGAVILFVIGFTYMMLAPKKRI